MNFIIIVALCVVFATMCLSLPTDMVEARRESTGAVEDFVDSDVSGTSLTVRRMKRFIETYRCPYKEGRLPNGECVPCGEEYDYGELEGC